jgi:hypothetical protein
MAEPATPLPAPDPDVPVERPSERAAGGPVVVPIPDTSALDEAFGIRTYGTAGGLEWETAPTRPSPEAMHAASELLRRHATNVREMRAAPGVAQDDAWRASVSATADQMMAVGEWLADEADEEELASGPR